MKGEEGPTGMRTGLAGVPEGGALVLDGPVGAAEGNEARCAGRIVVGRVVAGGRAGGREASAWEDVALCVDAGDSLGLSWPGLGGRVRDSWRAMSAVGISTTGRGRSSMGPADSGARPGASSWEEGAARWRSRPPGASPGGAAAMEVEAPWASGVTSGLVGARSLPGAAAICRRTSLGSGPTTPAEGGLTVPGGGRWGVGAAVRLASVGSSVEEGGAVEGALLPRSLEGAGWDWSPRGVVCRAGVVPCVCGDRAA